MHLQKQQSRIYNGKEYPKYVIVIPPSEVERLGWKNQDKLVSNVIKGKLIIEKMGVVSQTVVSPDSEE